MAIKAISDLNAALTLSSNDQVPISSTNNYGDARRVSISQLAAFIQTLLQPPSGDDKITQYATPTAGTTVTVAAVNGVSVPVFLYLTPAGVLATLTIALPAAGAAMDRQEILIATTQTITALTVSAAGLTVINAPTTLVAGAGAGSFRMRFDAVNNVWVMVT